MTNTTLYDTYKNKKIDYFIFKLIKRNRDISFNATLKQTRSSIFRNANSKREICKRNTNQQNRELPTMTGSK